MFIPFISNRSTTQNLGRRKGGGGGGRGSSGGGGSTGKGSGGSTSGGKTGGSSGNSGGSKGTGSGSKVPISIKTPTGATSSAVPYSGGSSKVTSIDAGLPFAGRSIGGGTRSGIFGTRQYGSGYPGIAGANVLGRGFPYYFWPVIFGADVGLDASHGIHTTEYGSPDNSSRPGGPLFDAPFQSLDGTDAYRVLADNATVQALITAIIANCSLSTTSITAIPFNDSDPNQPQPEQVVQYYRASSIALTLSGYNDTSVFSSDDNAPDTPLPATINATFLDCLNQTIGAAAPLINNTALLHAQMPALLGLILMTLHCLNWFS